MNRTILALCFATLVACSTPQQIPTPQRNASVTLLDNKGGFSHPGHRIELISDGRYTDTNYTDVVGDEHTKRGRYTFNHEQTLLFLSPRHGETQHFYRVDCRGQQYWVRADERTRITNSAEGWLRQTSLRLIP